MLIYLCLLERNLPNNKLERFLEYLAVVIYYKSRFAHPLSITKLLQVSLCKKRRETASQHLLQEIQTLLLWLSRKPRSKKINRSQK